MPIQPEAADNTIGGPGSVENVARRAAGRGHLRSASSRQYSWRWPYWDDEVSQTMAVLKAAGVLAAFKGEGVSSTPTSRTATRASSTTTPTTSAGRCSSATSAKS